MKNYKCYESCLYDHNGWNKQYCTLDKLNRSCEELKCIHKGFLPQVKLFIIELRDLYKKYRSIVKYEKNTRTYDITKDDKKIYDDKVITTDNMKYTGCDYKERD